MAAAGKTRAVLNVNVDNLSASAPTSARFVRTGCRARYEPAPSGSRCQASNAVGGAGQLFH
jgi:hypothetical protein